MKRVIGLFSLYMCAVMMLSAQTGSFTIHGNLEGMTNRHQLFLFNMENGAYHIDTLSVGQGTFTYKGSCNGREQRLLILSDTLTMNEFRRKSEGKRVAMYGDFNLSIFVHPQADIELSGNASDFPFIRLKDARNPINEDYMEVKLLGEKEQKEINRLHYVANEAFWNGGKEAAKVYENQMEELRESIARKQKAWIASHPDKEYAACLYTATGMYEDSAEALKAQYEKFALPVRQSVYGQALAEKIRGMEAIVPGAEAPAFTMRDVISGKDLSLSHYKGKYVIIDFWGSWCGPCRKSHPHLLQLYSRYKEKGLSIVGIAADHKDEVIRKAASEDGLLWPQLNMYEKRAGQPEINKAYNVSAFPSKFLINPDGKIEAIFVGDTKEIDSLLEKLLGD